MLGAHRWQLILQLQILMKFTAATPKQLLACSIGVLVIQVFSVEVTPQIVFVKNVDIAVKRTRTITNAIIFLMFYLPILEGVFGSKPAKQ